MSGPFTIEDFAAISRRAVDAWGSAVEGDWSVPAGTLEWSCIHAPDGAPPEDPVDGLRGACELLRASIVAAPPDTMAILGYDRNLQPLTGDGSDFAARGAHELILHAHDVCTGLGVTFEPPAEVCVRLLDHTAEWPRVGTVTRTGDPWSDLLVRSGRPGR